MFRRISVVAACAAMLALGALPASAATPRVHSFAIPGVYGVHAWGSYTDIGPKVRVTVCAQDNARSVYGAGAVGLAFTAGYRRHDSVDAVTVGYGHSQCQTMVTSYRNHLVVEAFSGAKNGKVRQNGNPRRIY